MNQSSVRPSVCLSVPSETAAAAYGGFAAERRSGQEISIDSGGRRAPSSSGAAARRLVANASSVSVDSWRRKLNTDLFAIRSRNLIGHDTVYQPLTKITTFISGSHRLD